MEDDKNVKRKIREEKTGNICNRLEWIRCPANERESMVWYARRI
jgi:hypothetical protein